MPGFECDNIAVKRITGGIGRQCFRRIEIEAALTDVERVACGCARVAEVEEFPGDRAVDRDLLELTDRIVRPTCRHFKIVRYARRLDSPGHDILAGVPRPDALAVRRNCHIHDVRRHCAAGKDVQRMRPVDVIHRQARARHDVLARRVGVGSRRPGRFGRVVHCVVAAEKHQLVGGDIVAGRTACEIDRRAAGRRAGSNDGLRHFNFACEFHGGIHNGRIERKVRHRADTGKCVPADRHDAGQRCGENHDRRAARREIVVGRPCNLEDDFLAALIRDLSVLPVFRRREIVVFALACPDASILRGQIVYRDKKRLAVCRADEPRALALDARSFEDEIRICRGNRAARKPDERVSPIRKRTRRAIHADCRRRSVAKRERGAGEGRGRQRSQIRNDKTRPARKCNRIADADRPGRRIGNHEFRRPLHIERSVGRPVCASHQNFHAAGSIQAFVPIRPIDFIL